MTNKAASTTYWCWNTTWSTNQHVLHKTTVTLKKPWSTYLNCNRRYDVTYWDTYIKFTDYRTPWWRHRMETFSALLAICAGNSPVPGEFSAQRPVTRNIDVFFDLRLNKPLSKQWWEAGDLRRYCAHYGVMVMRCPHAWHMWKGVLAKDCSGSPSWSTILKKNCNCWINPCGIENCNFYCPSNGRTTNSILPRNCQVMQPNLIFVIKSTRSSYHHKQFWIIQTLQIKVATDNANKKWTESIKPINTKKKPSNTLTTNGINCKYRKHQPRV